MVNAATNWKYASPGGIELVRSGRFPVLYRTVVEAAAN